MSIAFGEVRTVPASHAAKTIMKQLENKKIFDEQRDVWRLGAAIGIAQNKVHEGDKRETFQNINSLDTDQVFAAIMLGLYPKLTPEERVKKLIDHAEWGIREISRKVKIDTLDFSTLGISEPSTVEKPEDISKLGLEELVKNRESLNLELKSSIRWDMDHDRLLDELSFSCLKTIVGFSNAREGGILLIGVDPNGTIIGLEKDYATFKQRNNDDFEQYLTSKISDTIGIDMAIDITTEFIPYKDTEVCKVTVKPGLEPAYLTQNGKQTFYLRVGNSTRPLTVEEATKYCIKRFKLI